MDKHALHTQGHATHFQPPHKHSSEEVRGGSAGWVCLARWHLRLNRSPVTGPSHTHMARQSAGSSSLCAQASTTNVPWYSPLQPPLEKHERWKWKPPQSKPPAADDWHTWLQRHEDANQAMADHWGPVSRKVEALEKSHAELLAKNEQLEQNQAKLLAEMERLAQTVQALARDVARTQPQIQQTGKPSSSQQGPGQSGPGPGPYQTHDESKGPSYQ